MRKAKVSHCLLSPYCQKRTRTPCTGRRLSSIGSRSGVSSSSSNQPLRHWPILLFSDDCCLGGYIVGSVVSDCSGSSPRANLYERDASSEQRREKYGKEKMKSVAANRRGRYSTETVREIETRPFGNDSVATASPRQQACCRGSHTGGDDHPPCSAEEHVAQPCANKGAQRTVCQEESRRPAMAGPSGESRGEKPFLGVVPESSEKKRKNEKTEKMK